MAGSNRSGSEGIKAVAAPIIKGVSSLGAPSRDHTMVVAVMTVMKLNCACSAAQAISSISLVLTALSQGYGEVAGERAEPLVRCNYPSLISLPKAELLAVISRAIHRKLVVSVKYSSNTSGTNKREIAPFALVNNGVRWHARAYDRKSSSFRDFVLRMQ